MRAPEFIQLTESEISLYNQASQVFNDAGLKNVPKLARVSKQRHLRIQASTDDIEAFLRKNNLQFNNNTPSLSGKFTPYAITFPPNFPNEELAGQTVYAVSSLAKKAKIAQKQLIPQTFGIVGEMWSKDSLVAKLHQSIPEVIDDETVTAFLIDLVDVAAGKKPAVDPAIMSEIDPDTRRIAGIDFGEILTPIVLADPSDQIQFPVGNEMLSDVEINGKQYSVKSASGSGTSFRAIQGLLDRVADVADNVFDLDEKVVYEFYRKFIDTPGKNVDKIIAASGHLATPEHEKLEEIVGKKDFVYQDLVDFAETFESYEDFLRAVEPASVAGGHARPTGMPQDSAYYMGKTDVEPKKRQAGKPSWDANQGTAGANIMVYIMGTAFLAHSKKDSNVGQFSSVIKKMMDEADAYLAKIDITKDGKIVVKKKKFSDIDFSFQYHAPSHIPGNNLPGFYINLP